MRFSRVALLLAGLAVSALPVSAAPVPDIKKPNIEVVFCTWRIASAAGKT